jgi:hypothetical protein
MPRAVRGAEEIAAVIAFHSARARADHRHNLLVDGGFTIKYGEDEKMQRLLNNPTHRGRNAAWFIKNHGDIVKHSDGRQPAAWSRVWTRRYRVRSAS